MYNHFDQMYNHFDQMIQAFRPNDALKLTAYEERLAEKAASGGLIRIPCTAPAYYTVHQQVTVPLLYVCMKYIQYIHCISVCMYVQYFSQAATLGVQMNT